MSNAKISRRSVLQLAGIGAGASLIGVGLTHRTYAQAAGDVEKSIEWAKTALPKSTPEIITAAAKEGKLTLLLLTYGDDAVITALIDKFNERYPFIDVSYTIQSAAQLTNRFNAEVNAKKGISDYVQLPPGLTIVGNYLKAGALAEFVISQDDAFKGSAKQSGIWYSWLRQYGVTAYRVGALTDEEKELIRTFEGLGDPRFKGRLGINGITNSVTQGASYTLLNLPDKSVWDRLVANKPHVKPATAALVDGLLAGEYDVSLLGASPTTTNAAKQGAPLEFVITSPASPQHGPGTISALAPNPNAARVWQDWVMSKEGQELWSGLSGSLSARDDVATAWAEQQPWFYHDKAADKDIDWNDFTAKQPEIVERFKKDLQAG